ncbi:hypothetical protein SAMN05192551_1115 [Tindallia magadiensis]|uniref:Uncharacterized protein n=1 Tax=Tindallia magadiensis TaxID=69895 RepID=A0A1I3GZN6_9FIRM|nr:hypothetical protein [Tindallia magadiensis]SFI29048.1 hypothetical protein SAMN05192551_1115 [Tindallia magadiensis]
MPKHGDRKPGTIATVTDHRVARRAKERARDIERNVGNISVIDDGLPHILQPFFGKISGAIGKGVSVITAFQANQIKTIYQDEHDMYDLVERWLLGGTFVLVEIQNDLIYLEDDHGVGGWVPDMGTKRVVAVEDEDGMRIEP